MKTEKGKSHHLQGSPMIIKSSSSEFAAQAATFFKGQPKATGDFAEKFPPIPLLLFFAPYADSYMWYPLAPQEDIGRVIEYAMEKKRFVPIGACLLGFEQRGERIHLSESLPHFVDPNFDAEEVLNGTVPFFMKEKFNYDLKSVRVSDLTKN